MLRHLFPFVFCFCALSGVVLAEDEDSDEVPAEVAQVRKAFHASAVRIYKSLVDELTAEQKQVAKDDLDADEAELPEKLADVVVTHFREALVVSREEAQALLAGKFDDRGNRTKVKEAKAFMAKAEIPLPMVMVVLFKKFDSGEIKSGFDLEFAARFLHHHVVVAKKALEGKRPPPKSHEKTPAKPLEAQPPKPSEKPLEKQSAEEESEK